MMKTQIEQFRISDNAQDRIKLPRVFWAGLKSIGLTPGAVLRQSNLPSTVYGGESHITSAQMFSIWQAIRELSKDPTVGWKFMSKVETDQYHPNLRADPFERTPFESDLYRRWQADKLWTLIPAQLIAGKFVASFKDYPPSQRVGSMNLDQVMESLQSGAGK